MPDHAMACLKVYVFLIFMFALIIVVTYGVSMEFTGMDPLQINHGALIR